MNKKAFYIIIPLILISIGFYYLNTSHSENYHLANNESRLLPIHLDNKTFNTIIQDDKANASIPSATDSNHLRSIDQKEIKDDITILFSPRNDIRSAIINYIQNESEGIICAAFRLTDTHITKALQNAIDRNVKITFIIDKEGLSAMHSKLLHFVGRGVPIYFYPPLGKIEDSPITGLMHNKILLFIKQKIIITGSFNFTKSAQDRNRENVVIIKNNHAVFDAYYKELENLIKESSLLQANYIERHIKKRNKKKK